MKVTVNILQTLTLPDFPSGSSINFHDGRLYIAGDDANYICVLDEQYQQIGKISLFEYPEKRIAKTEKTDLETAVIITSGENTHLLAFGSASTDNRKRVISIVLSAAGTTPDYHKFSSIPYPDSFFRDLQAQQVHTLNIEGATVIGDQLVFANRGNHAHPVNQLLLTRGYFGPQTVSPEMSVATLLLSSNNMSFAGVSELCYVTARDLLLLTLSSEETMNTTDDGSIGDSYLAWITEASKKITAPTVQTDGIINLSDIDTIFHQQKIEGVCVGKDEGDALLLHLVADNDCGDTSVFRVRMQLA
ncbi:DUF6929 family protein [Chitinophaga solisilvae]|uniref:DUF6929 family protein n=1 Tax=Chitinophaga solisilvae TaxID=1233460 RepID=UPI00136B515E|nr:hypothetical protein [Chitinophaga solisilvae]